MLQDYQEEEAPIQLAQMGNPGRDAAWAERLQGLGEIEQQAIAREREKRKKLADLQSDPNVQAFFAREQEQRQLQQLFQRNPKLQEQFMLEREKARLRPVTPLAPVVAEIADPANPMRAIKIDARTGKKIGDAAPKQNEPAGLAGESAGKIAMADQAVLDLRDARSLLFDDKGELNRGTVAAMNVPFTAGVPGNTAARSAYSKLHNAVAAKLRIETGAAATESEVKGILDRFLPKISDPASVAAERLDRLENFMNTTIDLTKGVRPDALKSRTKAPTAPQRGIPTFATEAEAAAAGLKPGTKIKIGNKTGTWQ